MWEVWLLEVVEVVALVDFLLDLEVLWDVEFEEYVVFGFGSVVVEPSEALEFVVSFAHEDWWVHVALRRYSHHDVVDASVFEPDAHVAAFGAVYSYEVGAIFGVVYGLPVAVDVD